MPCNVLLLFHCGSNTGYAIAPLERAFHRAALALAGDSGTVHYAYRSLERGRPVHLADQRVDVTRVDYLKLSLEESQGFIEWVRERRIDLVLGFDLPVRAAVLDALNEAGGPTVVSYWGAAISDVFPWYLRPLRRLQYLTSRNRPHFFIFESEGMRRGAILGAAIPRDRTAICRLGVDMTKFRRDDTDEDYAYVEFGIPQDRQIVFFSGHMEQRKGVDVLIRAFCRLLTQFGRRDLHLLLLGNQGDDEGRLVAHIPHPALRDHITFGGYRTDIARIHHSVSVGVIPSTGWDSFTMSAVELAASSIPLVVSDLPGLREAVVLGETGLLFPAGDDAALASCIDRLVSDPNLRVSLGAAARLRASEQFSVETQTDTISALLRTAVAMHSK
jgi:glycosyltransferase involved in cell wall biosynthesis